MWWIPLVQANPCADVQALKRRGVDDAAVVAAMATWADERFRPSTPDCLMRHGVDASIVTAAADRARPVVHTFADDPADGGRPVELGVGVSASLGSQATPGDGLVRLGGFGAVHLAPVVAVELEGAWSPSVGDGGWTSISRSVAPGGLVRSRTRVNAQGALRFAFTPFAGDLRVAGVASALGLDLAAGFGLVSTSDDLVSLQAVGDPVAEATEHQLHPSLAWSAGPRVALGERWSLRTRVDGAHWIETYESVNLQPTTRIGVGVGVSARL